MDKTEEYEEMCEKSKEIQKIGKVKVTELDDWYYEKATQLFSIGTFADESDIWLPRQDQLQEMALEHLKLRYPNYNEEGKVIGYNYDVLHLLNGFNNFMYDVERREGSTRVFSSLEQMWLAFLMWVKFEKRWNRKEWIKK